MRSLLWIGLGWAAVLPCVAQPGTVQQAARRFDEISAEVPSAVATEFRAMAAKVLQLRHPELAEELAAAVPALEKRPVSARGEAVVSPAAAAIFQKFGRFGEVSTDADRASLILDLASQVRALPSGAAKLELARGLCGAATEGDIGPQTIMAVADTLGDAIRGARPDADAYLELASLIHYEHLRVSMKDPALAAALALLDLRESLVQEAGFSLAALDGRVYSLEALRGTVVLVNFWATSCMPCRKEMPDLEKLYRAFGKRRFVVLAISTEPRELLAEFVARWGYSFPVLLDPGGKASAEFGIDGIPRSFVFDAEGKLVAEAIDRRSESQMRALLKAAGLE